MSRSLNVSVMDRNKVSPHIATNPIIITTNGQNYEMADVIFGRSMGIKITNILLKCIHLILGPPNKSSSAKFLICCNFQTPSMWLKSGENVVRVCKTAWIRVRCRVTQLLIGIQAVFMWNYSHVWRSKG